MASFRPSVSEAQREKQRKKKRIFRAAPQLTERLKEAEPPCDLVTRVLSSRSASLPGLAALTLTMPLATRHSMRNGCREFNARGGPAMD